MKNKTNSYYENYGGWGGIAESNWCGYGSVDSFILGSWKEIKKIRNKPDFSEHVRDGEHIAEDYWWSSFFSHPFFRLYSLVQDALCCYMLDKPKCHQIDEEPTLKLIDALIEGIRIFRDQDSYHKLLELRRLAVHLKRTEKWIITPNGPEYIFERSKP